MQQLGAEEHGSYGRGGSVIEMCLVPGCLTADLSQLSRYHQRHRVCQVHLKADRVKLDGGDHRFCQQCGRFQPLSDFREDRRSCKAALRAHNARRRHSSMASDNAVYQGRFRASNKRGLLSTAPEGPSASAGRRSASISSSSYNSAPALLQRAGSVHREGLRRLRSSGGDWPASNSDGACTVEQDSLLADSPNASFGSAAAVESPPRRRARTDSQQQLAAAQDAQVQALHVAYMQQHSRVEWAHGCSPTIAQLDAMRLLQCSQAAAQGLAARVHPSDSSAHTVQQGPAGHALPGAHDSQGQPLRGGRCRLGQAGLGTDGQAEAAGAPACADSAGPGDAWRGFQAGSAPPQAAPSTQAWGHAPMVPGWQQQDSPAAGQQVHCTQGFPPAAGMMPGWHSMAASMQGYSPAVLPGWQGLAAPPQQQVLSVVSTQGCADAMSMAAGWQQHEAVPALQQCLSSSRGPPAAANGVPSWQQPGSMPAAQQVAATGAQGYGSPGMQPEWHSGACSSAQLPLADGCSGPVVTLQGTVPPAQPQQSSIGHVGWPAAALQPSFPQPLPQPQLQSGFGLPAQHLVGGGPSASHTYMHAGAGQAMPAHHQQGRAPGVLRMEQHVSCMSAPEREDGSTQTLCSQESKPAPLQHAGHGRTDWLDVLTCGGEDAGDDAQGAALSTPHASTAPPAPLPACRLQEGLLVGALAAALATAPAGAAQTELAHRFSTEVGLLDCFDDANDTDLPSEEVNALLDQALDDLFQVNPTEGDQAAVPICCTSSSEAAGSPAGPLGESLPCASSFGQWHPDQSE